MPTDPEHSGVGREKQGSCLPGLGSLQTGRVCHSDSGVSGGQGVGRGHLGRDLPSSLAGQPPLQMSPEGDRVGTPWCPACFGTPPLTLLGRPRSVEKAVVRREPCRDCDGCGTGCSLRLRQGPESPVPERERHRDRFSPDSGFSALTAPRQ